ncbi:MAG: hypothetical protein JEZ01_11510 [Labilibaculum sp.]|nr:hypothetical protein [Labilibaculum sp.]MBI9058379.1 hypothetical protein [Labilibaculum sp.]
MKSVVSTLADKAAIRAIAKGNKKINFDTERARIEKYEIFMRKAMKGKTGIQEILKASDVQTDGVRNIDSGRLNADTAFLVTGILISTATTANPADTDQKIAVAEFVVGSDANNKFHNSELSLKIANEEKVKGVLRHMTPNVSGDDITTDMAYEVSPFVIAPNQSIKPELQVFEDPTSGTEDLVIEITLVGYKITENNA